MIKNSFLKLLSFFIVIAIVVNLLVAFRIIAFEGRGFGIFAIINIIIVYFYFRFKNKEIEK
ncbi:hypothetical protein RNS32_02160 [Staphylococcus pseudintermedius]|uniref:Uncharacterized protein n=3 Tax=Staphylococcus pseudintermedius TaxID=283734 RepID=A0A1B1P130_STAPS|nr:hypothetical protein [Staphylococcus pseudintermedius]ANQ88447.1 hypothetical protein A9I65_07380 [Staphylococcus pseudintermedius]ANS89669.1 hypothetical protein A6M57_6765 [Staphylococcus pseudintermedius]AYG56762.1 hypothetical protein D8L98_10185 [Staphylococcus pseudintermedius]EGQ0291630.1 hypothetical protein [Staphylococcus pseudintermedius]EGQ0322748.1 hypothetical protein [Staphylococcus pseudintermedius]